MLEKNTRKATITEEHLAEARALKEIWDRVKPGSQKDFGSEFDIGGQTAVNNFLNGKSALSLKAASGFAAGLDCKISDFSPRLAAFTDQLALATYLTPEERRMAAGGTTNILPGPEVRGKVPLISWVRAGDLCESPDTFQPGEADTWLDCPVPHGPRTFCLELSGDSMDDGSADAYRDGEIIFVDPDASADPGRDVVVRTPDNKTTFKRLKQDMEGKYLLGLNGKKIVRVPEGTEFCGVVIFSGRRR